MKYITTVVEILINSGRSKGVRVDINARRKLDKEAPMVLL